MLVSMLVLIGAINAANKSLRGNRASRVVATRRSDSQIIIQLAGDTTMVSISIRTFQSSELVPSVFALCVSLKYFGA